MLLYRQQKRREAEERRSSERRLERRSWAIHFGIWYVVTNIVVSGGVEIFLRYIFALQHGWYNVYSHKWKEIFWFSWSWSFIPMWQQDLLFIKKSYEIVVPVIPHVDWLELGAYFISLLTVVLSWIACGAVSNAVSRRLVTKITGNMRSIICSFTTFLDQ